MQTYRVVSQGVDVFFGPEFGKAQDAFKETRESVQMWVVNDGYASLLRQKDQKYVKLQDVARYKS